LDRTLDVEPKRTIRPKRQFTVVEHAIVSFHSTPPSGSDIAKPTLLPHDGQAVRPMAGHVLQSQSAFSAVFKTNMCDATAITEKSTMPNSAP